VCHIVFDNNNSLRVGTEVYAVCDHRYVFRVGTVGHTVSDYSNVV
jgi:hypothetical protein